MGPGRPARSLPCLVGSFPEGPGNAEQEAALLGPFFFRSIAGRGRAIPPKATMLNEERGRSMTTPKPPTPRTAAEIWDALVQEAGEDEIAAASALSVEEAEAYLRAQGFDVEAER